MQVPIREEIENIVKVINTINGIAQEISYSSDLVAIKKAATKILELLKMK